MQNTPRLGLQGEISVGQLFFTQDRECVVDQESSHVEHDKNLGEQRFNQGLARFLRDAARDVGLVCEKNLLEAAQYPDAIADSPGVPVPLRGACAGHRSADFGRTGAIQFAQNFTCRRVHGSDAGDGEWDVGGHLRRSVRGTARVRHHLQFFYELSSLL